MWSCTVLALRGRRGTQSTIVYGIGEVNRVGKQSDPPLTFLGNVGRLSGVLVIPATTRKYSSPGPTYGAL